MGVEISEIYRDKKRVCLNALKKLQNCHKLYFVFRKEVGPELESGQSRVLSATILGRKPLNRPTSGPMIRLQRGQSTIRPGFRHETLD